MHTMHLLPGVAIQPNLELKNLPKQLLGSLPLVIALPVPTFTLTKETSGGQRSNLYFFFIQCFYFHSFMYKVISVNNKIFQNIHEFSFSLLEKFYKMLVNKVMMQCN